MNGWTSEYVKLLQEKEQLENQLLSIHDPDEYQEAQARIDEVVDQLWELKDTGYVVPHQVGMALRDDYEYNINVNY